MKVIELYELLGKLLSRGKVSPFDRIFIRVKGRNFINIRNLYLELQDEDKDVYALIMDEKSGK